MMEPLMEANSAWIGINSRGGGAWKWFVELLYTAAIFQKENPYRTFALVLVQTSHV